jgi:hypothetical protein
MLNIHETVDGITYAVNEIDDEIRSHIPEIRRRVNNRCMVELGIDELLDTRNDLTSILGELMIDEYERMMTE